MTQTAVVIVSQLLQWRWAVKTSWWKSEWFVELKRQMLRVIWWDLAWQWEIILDGNGSFRQNAFLFDQRFNVTGGDDCVGVASLWWGTALNSIVEFWQLHSSRQKQNYQEWRLWYLYWDCVRQHYDFRDIHERLMKLKQLFVSKTRSLKNTPFENNEREGGQMMKSLLL